MQIPVNKDIDDYKDDFFKGLTMKQTVICAIAVAAGAGSFLLFCVVLKLPQTISLYLIFPVVVPIVAVGFLKIDGMTPLDYLKKRKSTASMSIYRFKPMVFSLIEQSAGNNGMIDASAGYYMENQQEAKRRRHKKMDKIGLLGPADENSFELVAGVVQKRGDAR